MNIANNVGETYSPHYKITIETTDMGFVKKYTSKCWTKKISDDNSFVMHQSVCGEYNHTLKFGPLQATLKELMEMGFIMEVYGFLHSRNQILRIIRGNERYKLSKIPTSQLLRFDDLTKFVKDAKKVHCEKEILNDLEFIHKLVPKSEKEPLDILMEKYPLKRKPIEFVGNQTLEHYVKQQLREQRRLQNVG